MIVDVSVLVPSVRACIFGGIAVSIASPPVVRVSPPVVFTLDRFTSETFTLLGADGQLGDGRWPAFLVDGDEYEVGLGRLLPLSGPKILAIGPNAHFDARGAGVVYVGVDERGVPCRDRAFEVHLVYTGGDAGFSGEAHCRHRTDLVHPLHDVATVGHVEVVRVIRLDHLPVLDQRFEQICHRWILSECSHQCWLFDQFAEPVGRCHWPTRFDTGKSSDRVEPTMSDAGDASVPEPPDPPDRDVGDVYVLGTAHISQASVDDVYETVERERPDVVAVELDEGRYRQMQGGTPDDIEAKDLLSGNTVFQFLAYWMLSYVQSKLGEQFDIEPGADMKAAIDAAESGGHGLALVDRDIQVTIQRFWARLSFTEKLKMVGALAFGITDPRTVSIALGATTGAFIGFIFAAFVAPFVGLEGALMLGITDPTTLWYAGAVGIGALAGIFLGLVFLPTLDGLESYTNGLLSGFSLRVLSGIALGIAACVTIVYTESFVGPLSAGTFENAGALSVRGGVGVVAGMGLGVLLGGIVGIVLDAFTADVEEIEEIDIEEMTDGDVVAAMMEEFRRFSPHGANALIDERDAYIAHNLHALRVNGYNVVAVVGAGHKAGIERYLENPASLPSMDSITGTDSGRRFSIVKIFGYLVMLAFFGFFFLLIMAGVQNAWLLQLFGAWFIFNGLFAFTFARLAGARWLSAGVGGSVAWLTSINPLLAPGWFAGYVELRSRPVNVTDIQTLNEIAGDTTRPIGEAMSEMIDVPLFRLILIVALTNVGSMIATFLFPIVVIPWLAPEVGGIDGLANELLTGAQNSLDLIRGLIGI